MFEICLRCVGHYTLATRVTMSMTNLLHSLGAHVWVGDRGRKFVQYYYPPNSQVPTTNDQRLTVKSVNLL